MQLLPQAPLHGLRRDKGDREQDSALPNLQECIEKAESHCGAGLLNVV